MSMNAIIKLKYITARTERAQAALASLIASIPADMREGFICHEAGSTKNRDISFHFNGQRVYQHWVKASGFFQAMTSPKLATMQENIEKTLATLEHGELAK